MKLYYYEAGNAFSEIKECEVEELNLQYRVISHKDEELFPVVHIRKKTMNTYDY